MKIELREAVREDAVYVGRHMREEDRREVEALGCDPESAAVLSYAESDVVYTGLVDGEPALIFGCGGPVLKEYAAVWALGTDACGRAPKAMVRFGREAVREFLKVYPCLENWCDARYERSLRWLRLLGFKVEPPAAYGPKGMDFCRLSIRSDGGDS